jgi:hypothetical protein
MRSNKENVDAVTEINLYYFMNLPCKQWELHKVGESSLKRNIVEVNYTR